MNNQAKKGIYTLANDAVYDQLVALLNSIERNVSATIPVCIIPYDSNIRKLRNEEKKRENLTIFRNPTSLARWDDFADRIWNNHPHAIRAILKHKTGFHWRKTIRKLCSFDGDFERFVYCDSDSLVMKNFDDIFKKLDNYDFIFDDWEHSKPDKDTMLDTERLSKTRQFTPEQIKQNIHCSDFFASKKGLCDEKCLRQAENELLNNGEIFYLSEDKIWDDVPIFCYLTLKSKRAVFNYTISGDAEMRTGNIAGVDTFVAKDRVLLNEGGVKIPYRVHYMGYTSREFRFLSSGIDRDVPHKDTFLYYRFLEEPEKMPKTFRRLNFSETLKLLYGGLILRVKKSLKLLMFIGTKRRVQ